MSMIFFASPRERVSSVVKDVVRNALTPRSALCFLALGLCANPLAAAVGDFQINVRASVERAFKGLGKEELREHGKLYSIISINQFDNEINDLARPVNEFALLKNLQRVLATRDFREAPAGTNPEILLTVLYGRGWLKNPYLEGTIVNEMTEPPTVTVMEASPYLAKRLEAGFEEKLQRAQGEKLMITVTAWEFPGAAQPGQKKPKPKQIWRTTMNIDDADQDLNALMEKMLEAGAKYFDRVVEDEVSIPSELPEGYVKVGTPTVVEKPERKK